LSSSNPWIVLVRNDGREMRLEIPYCKGDAMGRRISALLVKLRYCSPLPCAFPLKVENSAGLSPDIEVLVTSWLG